ncbi:protein ORF63 [Cyprinid herpesvirus 3]|nr:protein ORF63 [Cyprinid herpesvirus 3]AOO32784.1 protein ORF63 [Cyprinid herpesvirus 3]AOO32941.1 protein ORF63 [Cyprinid herpesvirus 3]AOO33253.1 protein ORF63 [Cyprinid herpesvirus 3]AOO33411.1 protein ORF63 [Cyprinid herpesvirus 3]
MSSVEESEFLEAPSGEGEEDEDGEEEDECARMEFLSLDEAMNPLYYNWIVRFNEYVLAHMPKGTDAYTCVDLDPVELVTADVPDPEDRAQLWHDWRAAFEEGLWQHLRSANELYSTGRTCIRPATYLPVHNQLVHLMNQEAPSERKAVLLWMASHLLTRVDDAGMENLASSLDWRVATLASVMSPRCALASLRFRTLARMRIGVVCAMWPLLEDQLARLTHQDWSGYLYTFRHLTDESGERDVFEMAANYRRRVCLSLIGEARRYTPRTDESLHLDGTKLRLAAAALTNATPYMIIDDVVRAATTCDHRAHWQERLGSYLDSRRSALHVLIISGCITATQADYMNVLWEEAVEISEAERAAV